MDKISIDKLVVFGNHGVFEAENMLGQEISGFCRGVYRYPESGIDG